MGSKFRLSPVIDSLVSQRHEGRYRDKEKHSDKDSRENEQSVKITENIVKTGPPLQKSEMVKQARVGEPDDEGSGFTNKSREAFLKGKSVPFVDIPPLKAVLRTPKIDHVREDQTSNLEPVYKTRAPVELGIDIEKLVESVLDMEIHIPLRSLAGVSNAVQKEIKKQVTKTRQATDMAVKVNSLVEDKEREESLIRLETVSTGTCVEMTEVLSDIPEGHLVADDPVLQFLLENKDAEPGDLIAAKSSEPLRAIYMTINGIGQEECLLDEGSMIVSMSKEVATQLGLHWDPSVRINMESASSHVEKTLGLAKNVRFSIAGLNLFLQVHILESPPYRVLLGLPFKSLASATSRAKLDGTSDLVLTDPNTHEMAVVPTYQRGMGPEELQKQKFQAFQ